MTTTSRRRRRAAGSYQLATWSVASLALAVLTIGTVLWLGGQPELPREEAAPLPEPRRTPTVAVLPFDGFALQGGRGEENLLALREALEESEVSSFAGALVARLGAPGRAGQQRLLVLGPAATRSFRVTAGGDRSRELRRLHRELGADSVVSGRVFEREERWQLLVEVVRASDGAHLWLEAFELDTPIAKIADQTVAAVRGVHQNGDS